MLITRIITAAFYGVAITAAVLFLPTLGVATVFGALWLAGAWEWAGFARFGSRGHIAYSLVFAAAMVGVWFSGRTWDVALLAVALAFWLLAVVAVLRFPRRFVAGVVIVSGFVVLLPSWRLLAQLHAAVPHGRGLAMTLLAIVWAADIGAYAFGRWLGRTKLAPAVSPGKTWEGMAGGVLLAALAAGAGAFWLDLPVVRLAALGVVTALASVLGDLTQSMFKRNVGLKDSGKLLPGHGGVLDRIDSLTAAIPVFVGGLLLFGIAV
ncbi:MAG: phosphatidate cytidylyltransferase [Gammaproteobacteria bacterium]